MDSSANEEGVGESPPPGFVHVAGGVVRISACELWPEHESFSAPCWIEREARPIDADDNVSSPTAAQLYRALAAGAIASLGALEQTISELGAERGVSVLAIGAAGASREAAALARRGVPLTELRPRALRVCRPCVPRYGRSTTWPAVRDPLDDAEPWLLDDDEDLVLVAQDGGWALLARTPFEHAMAWVPLSALASEGNEDEASSLERDAPAFDAVTHDAPLVEAIVGLASAALARLSAASKVGDAVPDAAAALLDAWYASDLRFDERLAALSATDVLVLAIVAAPALERSIAQSYRALAAPDAAITVGLVADLVGARAATRVRVHRRLGEALPLRVTGAVLIDEAHDVPSAAVPIAVAPWVVTAIFG